MKQGYQNLLFNTSRVEEGMWDGQIRILDLEPENA
jgi:hypothetical protein